MEEIYLDNHTFARPAQYAQDILFSSLQEYWGDRESLYEVGKKIRIREKSLFFSIEKLFSPSNEQLLYFFSSYEEAMFRLYSYFYHQIAVEGKNHFLFWEKPNFVPFQECIIEEIPKKDGKVDFLQLASMITPKTGVIALPLADGYTGLVQDISAVYLLGEKHGIHVHIDLTFTVGKMVCAIKNFPKASFSVSSKALHTPTELGAIFFAEVEEEQFFRSKYSLCSLATFSEACKHAYLFLENMQLEIARLTNQLESFFSPILSKEDKKLPNVALLAFHKIEGEMLLYTLNKAGVFVSYNRKKVESFSAEKKDFCSILSFALSRFTTKKEIEKLCSILQEELTKLQPLARYL